MQWTDLAARFGDRPALISDRESLSFNGYNRLGNRYARWALANGVGKGDTVCLLMPNRPEYAAAWLGIARAGGVTALLNTELDGAALAHCINSVAPRHIIVAAELADVYADGGAGNRREMPPVWSHGPDRLSGAGVSIKRSMR